MKKKTNPAKMGQSMVEYAAILVLSTLMVAGIIGGARELMPAVFESLLNNNETALSDGDPAMATSPSPTPTPTPSPSPCHGNGKKSC